MKRSSIVLSLFVLCAVAVGIVVGAAKQADEKAAEADLVEIKGVALPRPRQGEEPIGTIMPFPGPQNPEHLAAIEDWLEMQGWKFCDGRALSRLEAPLLYAVIGISHGGGFDSEGQNEQQAGRHFNVPDYRGRFLRGLDTTAKHQRDPDVADREHMNFEGNIGMRVGTVQTYATGKAKKPLRTQVSGDHSHVGTTGPGSPHNHNDGPHDVLLRHDGEAKDTTDGLDNDEHEGIDEARIAEKEGRLGRLKEEKSHTHPISLSGGGHEHIVSEGGDSESRPPNAAVNWIIKFKYPDTN
jgi:hypothetical protein